MRILIVGDHNPFVVSPRAFRIKELAYELAQRGHNVDVVVGSENRIIYGFNKSYKEDSKLKEKEAPKERNPLIQKVHTTAASVYHYFFGFRSDRKTFFKVKKTLTNCTDYDVVIGVAAPFYTLMVVAASRFRPDTRIIFDSGDPFYGNNEKLAPYWKTIQRKVFLKTDYLCLPTEYAVKAYRDYIDEKKIRIIPQGFDLDQFELAEYKKGDIPVFAYAGRFYQDLRNPVDFFKYLKELETDYRFYIYTNTDDKAFKELKPYIDALEERVVVVDFVPRDECIKRLSEVDFIINFENTTSFQVPSKLMDYGIAGRPVLSIPAGKFNPEKLNEFLVGDYSHKVDIDISIYDIKKVASQFEELF